MVRFLLAGEVERYQSEAGDLLGHEVANVEQPAAKLDVFWKLHHAFNHQFSRLRESYRKLLDLTLRHRLGSGFVPAILRSFVRVVSIYRRGFLPSRGCRSVPIARPGTCGHAH